MSTFRGYFDSGRTVSAAIEAANRWQSIFQIAYSVIVIGLLDHIQRPILVGNDAKC